MSVKGGIGSADWPCYEGKVMRKVLIGAISLSAIMFGAAPASAHTVGAHQHVLTTPGGTVLIGPDACTRGPIGAFQNFHHNIHEGAPVAAFGNPSNPVSFSGAGC